MIVRYPKKEYVKGLIFGLLFMITGFFFIMEEPAKIYRYGFLLVGVLHLITGFYQLKMPYLKFHNGRIKRGGLISKSISLSEVERIRKFAGDYTLFTPEKKLKINSVLIRKSQITELDKFLRSLEIPFEETASGKQNYS